MRRALNFKALSCDGRARGAFKYEYDLGPMTAAAQDC